MDLLQTGKPFQLGNDWVLFQPDSDRLMALNQTGKMTWDLLREGYGQDEIASAFVQYFGLTVEQALTDVREVLAGLDEAGHAAVPSDKIDPDPDFFGLSLTSDESAIQPGLVTHGGTFRFGNHCIQLRLHDTLASIGTTYFSRFRHRAIDDAVDADVLELFGDPGSFRLSFRGEVIVVVSSLAELFGRISELLLAWEHPNIDFLAYFHAAAVSRGDHSILLPGVSGIGKSTLTAYLVGHGFIYHGDDSVGMAASDWSLRPLPTRLSIKSGSWPILEHLYPELPRLPTVHCYGRDVRYVEPRQTRNAGGAPSIILFPSYAKGGDTLLSPLTPFQTMKRLLDTSMDLDQPATEAKLAEFIRFVEQTPAYELSYADLPNAKAVIEELLDHAN